MATVGELTDPYVRFMRNPLPAETPSICRVCRTFTDGYDTCYPCEFHHAYADAVVPISYSEHFGQLHTNLAAYKRASVPAAGPLRMQIAAVLWRFLSAHEACIGQAASVPGFDLVTTVPSGSAKRDTRHPLRWIVSSVVGPTRDRFERLLTRSGVEVANRTVDPIKYSAARTLAGESILLIDDTWTTGANAQSAAGALKAAGAGRIAVLVIGRHVNPEYNDNATRLAQLPEFSWATCAVH